MCCCRLPGYASSPCRLRATVPPATSSTGASSSVALLIRLRQLTEPRSWSTSMSTQRPHQRSRCWPLKIELPSYVTQAGDQGMAILVLTSTAGSPGVTTLAVGLALTWPRPILLADCDPGAHQAILAGYLAGRSTGGKGLLRVAEAHRDRRPLREAVLDQTLPLSIEQDIRRLFLPGFTKPSSAAHFAGVWDDLAEAFDRLAD